jgi:hypothetical protein
MKTLILITALALTTDNALAQTQSTSPSTQVITNTQGQTIAVIRDGRILNTDGSTRAYIRGDSIYAPNGSRVANTRGK